MKEIFLNQTKVLLIRHGETDWNKQKIMQGGVNRPLNETGLKQAEDLAQRLLCYYPNITVIYSSDLDRAFQTAEKLAIPLQLDIKKRASLREMNWGAIEGLTKTEIDALYGEKRKEIEEKYPDPKQRWHISLYPGSETEEELLQRGKEEVLRIANSHPGETIAIFSHGKLIRTLIEDCLDRNPFPHLDNCSVAIFQHSAQVPSLPLQFVKQETWM